ncbi:FAD-dependent oxidoreductase [Microbacterium horticulturae]
MDATAPAGVPLRPGSHHDVIVVGAGITGLATAVMLVRRGMDVAVIEAGEVAQLASGGNTGKLSLLQGSVLSTLRRHHPAALVRAYVDANRDGMRWLTEFIDEAGVSYTRRTAYSYAQTSDGEPMVAAEQAAAREAGLTVRRAVPDETGFPVAASVALDDQVAVDPVAVTAALAHAFLEAGGTLHTGSRVDGVRTQPRPSVRTAAGPVFADHIVLATGTPIVDRGLYFAKTHGLRSYCVAFATDSDAVPDGMFLSVDGPTRSIRPVTPGDGPAGAQLIVGGNGHPVGRCASPRGQVDDLIAWTQRHFPSADPIAEWSAQDYQSHDLIPFVGAMPRGLGRIRFATGYAKWGLSNGPAAALRISTEILGVPRRDRAEWMRVVSTRMTVPADLGRGIAENVRIGGEAARGWADALRDPAPVPQPDEGRGILTSRAGHPIGVSTVDGDTRAVSAVCPHLGGVLRWNDAECTWDCPLHASRFGADGRRIEGPATDDLRVLPRRGRIGAPSLG